MLDEQAITIRNIQEVFFRMEVEEGLFSRRMADGTYYWDILRSDIYVGLHTAHGGPFAYPQALPPASIKSRAKDLFKPLLNWFSRRYLISRAPTYLFVTGQRVLQGDRLIDNISDHLYDLVSDDAVAIELMNRSAISLRKMVMGEKTRIPPVAIRSTKFDAELADVATQIEAAIGKYFRATFDVRSLVGDLIGMYRQTRTHYRKLFAKHRPRFVIGINNGTLKGLFAAARDSSIPAIELQHGGSSHHTIIWSYPESIEAAHPGLSLPTAYFTYADYWTSNTHLPVKVLRTIGNDSFVPASSSLESKDVLVISSYMYQKALLDVAIQAADLDTNRQIYFKLHPHEYGKKSSVVAACAGKQNLHVVDDDPGFAELFERCGYVVGVQSSVLYVALQARKKVCLLKVSNYFWHDDVFAYVELFEHARELHGVTHDNQGLYFKNMNAVPEFSRPFDPQLFMQALGDVEKMGTA